MTAPTGRLPIRPHLRPQPHKMVTTAADLPDWLLDAFPHVADEMNLVPMDAFIGPGRPGPGWDGWTTEHLWLDEAMALPVAGEA